MNVFFYLVSFSLVILLLLLINGKHALFIDVFNQFAKCSKLRLYIIVVLFSIAGTPPTPLFLIKSANLYYVYQNSYSILLVLLLIVNLISITFYVQLIRFIYGSKSKLQILIIGNIPFVSKKAITLLLSLSLLSLFLLVTPYDFLLPITLISSY